MSPILKVNCPCCKSVLDIDQETGAILAHKENKREVDSLESFMAKQKSRNAELDEKFKSAREKEKSKLDLIEKKFKLAVENKDNLKDPPPTVMWD
jgi:hypothetical protein